MEKQILVVEDDEILNSGLCYNLRIQKSKLKIQEKAVKQHILFIPQKSLQTKARLWKK